MSSLYQSGLVAVDMQDNTCDEFDLLVTHTDARLCIGKNQYLLVPRLWTSLIRETLAGRQGLAVAADVQRGTVYHVHIIDKGKTYFVVKDEDGVQVSRELDGIGRLLHWVETKGMSCARRVVVATTCAQSCTDIAWAL